MKKQMAAALALSLGLAFFSACAAPEFWMGRRPSGFLPPSAEGGNYVYDSIEEQDFKQTAEEPSCYFSLDKNTAGYSLVRAQLNMRREIAADSVRLEELVNYFSYDFPAPEEGELAVSTYVLDCPWSANKLLTVGVRTAERRVEAQRSNYVLLIDTSGSMSARVAGEEDFTCLDLVKRTALGIAERLGEEDSLSIVTYASGAGELLEPVLMDEEGKNAVKVALASLRANGSTNGSGGIRRAYENAERYYSKDGNNRVILMSDGDFNVGISSEEGLKALIREKAASGVYLSVLGYGMGNMRDDLMQTLALNGNGNYAYIDTSMEAERICGELDGMLTTVAKDAKAGVTFSQNVKRYRILGYDMKLMSESDFNDEEKDAGEIGSNLCVAALFELELDGDAAGEPLADVTIRYKTTAGEDRETSQIASNLPCENEDVSFIACVAEFGLVLRRSAYAGNANLKAVLSRLGEMGEYLAADACKAEFPALVRKAVESGFYESEPPAEGSSL